MSNSFDKFDYSKRRALFFNKWHIWSTLLLYTMISQVTCTYIITTTFYSLKNPSGLIASKRCCDSIATTDCMQGNLCDLQVVLCLRPAGSMVGKDTEFNSNFGCGPTGIFTNAIDNTLEVYFQGQFFNFINPLNFEGRILNQTGLQLLAVITDRDSIDNDLIDRIAIPVPFMYNGTVPRRNYTGIFNLGTIEVGLEILCVEEFEGNCSSCSPSCTCNFCNCPPGFTDDDCSVDIDECERVTCNQRGNCTDMINGFRCECDPEYEGDLCERKRGSENYELTIQLISLNNSEHRLAETDCIFYCDDGNGYCDSEVILCVRQINSTFSNFTSIEVFRMCSNQTYRSGRFFNQGIVNFEERNDSLSRIVIQNLTNPSEGFQIYLEVVDVDVLSEDDHENDLIDRIVDNMVVESGSSLTCEQYGIFKKATITMEITASCLPGSSGPFCESASNPLERFQKIIEKFAYLFVVPMVVVMMICVVGIICRVWRTSKRKNAPREFVSGDSIDQAINICYNRVLPDHNYEEISQELLDSRSYAEPSNIECMENINNEMAGDTEPVALVEQTDYDDILPYVQPASIKDILLRQITKDFKIPVVQKDNIKLGFTLGNGAFGKVYQAIMSTRSSLSTDVDKEIVAVKTIDSISSEDDEVKFLQEAAIMGQFKHPSILSIRGITLESPMMIIVDIMEGGDLRHYLVNNVRNRIDNFNPLHLTGLLLSYSRQIAFGMSLMAQKMFIHRDLAARNVLVSKDGTYCKIADFGLSRDLLCGEYYISKDKKIPLKWTAPEALKYQKYSVKSDVWSYGCVLYEIWSLGYHPYHNMSNHDVIKYVLKGKRLPPPPGCPREIYTMMMSCWHPDKDSRCEFSEIIHIFQRPDYVILNWSEKDLRAYSEETRTIGKPLELGHSLFKDLQKLYL